MPYQKLLIVLLLFIISCSPRPPIGPNDSELRAFHTICKGSLKFVNPFSGRADSSTKIVSAGEQDLKLRYTSSYSYDYQKPEPLGYLCAYVTHHNLSFESKPGLIYRFYVDESTPGSYQVQVLEQLKKKGPKTIPVPAESIQTSVKKHCRFFHRYDECY